MERVHTKNAWDHTSYIVAELVNVPARFVGGKLIGADKVNPLRSPDEDDTLQLSPKDSVDALWAMFCPITPQAPKRAAPNGSLS